MKLEVKYYVARKLRKVICTTQRAASASMVESLGPATPANKVDKISPTQVKSLQSRGYDVLLWVREPLDRFACAYEVFGRGFNFSVRRFIDHALETYNPHWSPQIELHTHGKIFLPTRVYPFGNLTATWEREVPGYPLIHIGANPNRWKWYELKSRLPSSYWARLLEYYEDDIVLHSLAKKRGVLQNADVIVEERLGGLGEKRAER